MKKTNQTDLDFDMINLDETAGWNRLELESALQEAKEETKEESLVFQGEVTISEEELFAEGELFTEEAVDTYEAEEYLDEEDEPLWEEEYEDSAVFAEEEYLDEKTLTGAKKKTSKTGKGKKSKKKKPLTLADKMKAAFAEMTALDGIVAVTGVMVLVIAIVTVSVFSGAKMAQQQVEAFAPLGEEMEYLTETGKGTLLAMADSQKLIQDEEEEEETTFEYEEKEMEVATVNVNMKMTSVQKDLKIKFVNHKTGKLIPHVEFKVSIEDANGKEKE